MFVFKSPGKNGEVESEDAWKIILTDRGFFLKMWIAQGLKVLGVYV